jgi:hypothetical protein
MSCASENVHVNSDPFEPDRQTERIYAFAFMYEGGQCFGPAPRCREEAMLQPSKDEEVMNRTAEVASAVAEQYLQAGGERP